MAIAPEEVAEATEATEAKEARKGARTAQKPPLPTVVIQGAVRRTQPGVWAILVISLTILAMLYLGGRKVTSGTFLALLLYALLGALYPPLGIGVGLVVVLYLFVATDVGGRTISVITKGLQ